MATPVSIERKQADTTSRYMEKKGWIKLGRENKVLSASNAPKSKEPSGLYRGTNGEETYFYELWVPVWVYILMAGEDVIDKTSSISGGKKRRLLRELNRATSSEQIQVAIVTEFLMLKPSKLTEFRVAIALCHNFIDTVVNESKVRQEKSSTH